MYLTRLVSVNSVSLWMMSPQSSLAWLPSLPLSRLASRGVPTD